MAPQVRLLQPLQRLINSRAALEPRHRTKLANNPKDSNSSIACCRSQAGTTHQIELCCFVQCLIACTVAASLDHSVFK